MCFLVVDVSKAAATNAVAAVTGSGIANTAGLSKNSVVGTAVDMQYPYQFCCSSCLTSLPTLPLQLLCIIAHVLTVLLLCYWQRYVNVTLPVADVCYFEPHCGCVFLQYVLLVVTDVAEGRSKLIVRGDRQSGYHMDVYEKATREVSPHKLHVSFYASSPVIPCSCIWQEWGMAAVGQGARAPEEANSTSCPAACEQPACSNISNNLQRTAKHASGCVYTSRLLTCCKPQGGGGGRAGTRGRRIY